MTFIPATPSFVHCEAWSRGALPIFAYLCKLYKQERTIDSIKPELIVSRSRNNNNRFRGLVGQKHFKKMKKALFMCLAMCLLSVAAFAQKEVTVKAGTLVPLQVTNPTKAADVTVGQKVAFRVSRDINVDGVTAIPYGTIVNGTVYEAKKSSWWGTKGRLGIKISELYGPNGEMIPLTNGDVYVTGKNRTALSVCLCLCLVWPACFICGSKAEIPVGYEIQANVAANTLVKVN